MMTEAQRAERAESRRQARERFDREYGGSEASSSFPGEPSSGDLYGIEERTRDAWARSPELRAEFGSYESYLAYSKAVARGAVRIIGRKA
jgi:hypothetical protein